MRMTRGRLYPSRRDAVSLLIVEGILVQRRETEEATLSAGKTGLRRPTTPATLGRLCGMLRREFPDGVAGHEPATIYRTGDYPGVRSGRLYLGRARRRGAPWLAMHGRGAIRGAQTCGAHRG